MTTAKSSNIGSFLISGIPEEDIDRCLDNRKLASEQKDGDNLGLSLYRLGRPISAESNSTKRSFNDFFIFKISRSLSITI